MEDRCCVIGTKIIGVSRKSIESRGRKTSDTLYAAEPGVELRSIMTPIKPSRSQDFFDAKLPFACEIVPVSQVKCAHSRHIRQVFAGLCTRMQADARHKDVEAVVGGRI